jgi:hypothetical protein
MSFSYTSSKLEVRRTMLRRLVAPSIVFLALAACASSPPPPPKFGDIRFTGEPPITLDVARIEVVNDFQPSFRAPSVEHEFAIPPQRALENLVRDRFRADGGGSDRQARISIDDASVREVNLPLAGGVEGAFTRQQAQRYDGHVAVRVEIVDMNGFVERTVSAEASVSRSITEGVTLNERDQLWYEISETLAHNIDRELDRQIHAIFPPYVR